MSFKHVVKSVMPRTSRVEHYVKDKILETAKAGLTSTIIIIDHNEGYKLNDVLSELEKDGFSYNYFFPIDNELNIELLGVVISLPEDILWYKKNWSCLFSINLEQSNFFFL